MIDMAEVTKMIRDYLKSSRAVNDIELEMIGISEDLGGDLYSNFVQYATPEEVEEILLELGTMFTEYVIMPAFGDLS